MFIISYEGIVISVSQIAKFKYYVFMYITEYKKLVFRRLSHYQVDN